MPSTTWKMDTRCQGKPAPKIIEAVRINGRYVDSSVIKEKAAGVLYASLATVAIALSLIIAMI